MPVNVQSVGLFQGRFKIQIRPPWPVAPAPFTGAEIRIVLARRGPAIKLPRRTFLHLAASAAALPPVSRIASAQTYPTRPVHAIVGFAAGHADAPNCASRSAPKLRLLGLAPLP
jgi:hypothetical protein